MERHPRAFWVDLVEELERGFSVAEVARRHGVHRETLRWWRTVLRNERKSGGQRLVPVVVTQSATAPSAPVEAASIDVVVRSVVVRIRTGTDVAYAAALIRALEPC